LTDHERAWWLVEMRNEAAARIAMVMMLCGASSLARAEQGAAARIDRSDMPQLETEPSDDVLVASRDALAGLASTSTTTSTQKPAPRASKRVDLSRFSNGPRWVPAARGRAQARAAELGIGSHEATIKLLRSGPSDALRAVVPGERPKTLLWPVPGGHPGRGFGFTRKVRSELRHNGIDIGAEAGTAVRAAEAGLVVYSDNTLGGYGNAVIVLHPGGLMTLYAHNQRNTVQPGYFVERGERIALLGATGYAWGPHLHFELRDGFRLRDPAPMIRDFHSQELAGPLAELASPARREPVAAITPAPAAPTAATTPSSDLGRTFRTLLFPLKGGELARPFHPRKHPAVTLTAAVGAGVRATADGMVTYSGPALPGHGDPKKDSSIVLQHPDGTRTTYTAPMSDLLASDTRVLRGQWLGRLAATDSAASELRFAWQREATALDPSPTLVGR
jgi:murein DD-endopeptidase MepM/ murein hydrolase activator NlpD